MLKLKRQGCVTTLSVLAVLTLMSGVNTMGQQKREYVQATAMGTSTQLGQVVEVNFIINETSTAEDRTVLVQVFEEKGSEGLANALDKMHSKGRISLTGTLGYDVNLIRDVTAPDGTRTIRFATDRPIRFGEVWSSSRSMDYALSMGEIVVEPGKGSKKGKITGKLFPAAQLKLDKDKELTIETYQNPWNLVNVKISH